MNRYGRDFRRLRNVIANILSLFAPLTHTLLLTTGYGVATFTRATTATLTDFGGLLKTIKSGEARFEGARREANELQKTENFENAIWEKFLTPSITDNFALAPDGTMTACKYVPSAQFSALKQAVTTGTKSISFWGRVVSGTRTYHFYTNGGILLGSLILTTTWRRYNLNFTIAISDTVLFWQDRNASGIVETHLWHPMLADVTDRSNQNPPEYVSNGAIRRNLLTYTEDFSNAVWLTTLAGTGVSATKTPNYGIAPDGTQTACRLLLDKGVGNTSGDYSEFYYSESNTAKKSTYIKTTDGTTKTINISGTSNISIDGTWKRVASTSLTGERFRVMLRGSFSNSQTADLLIWHPQSEFSTTETDYQKITDASAIDFNNYHGANVDGVKNFTTLNGNTVLNNVVTEATGAEIPEATLKGVLIETASTNLFLNSATLVTQNITTSATSYTISFYGTGTIVLSGTYIGTLVGTGANDKASLSFTATAGTLIATITGNCTNGQCEALPMATSYIPTTTATVTRNADVLTFPNAGNMSDILGTVLMDVTPAFDIPSGTVSGYGQNYLIDFGANVFIKQINNSVSRTDLTTVNATPSWIPLKGTKYKIGSRYGSAGQRNWVNGTTGNNGAFDGSINTGTNMTIGGYGGGATYNWGGWIKNLKIYKKALSDTTIAEQTTLYLNFEDNTPLTFENGTRINL